MILRAAQPLIELALNEDVGAGDITTDLLLDRDSTGSGVIVAKQDLVLAGLPIAQAVFAQVDARLVCHFNASDGESVTAGSEVMAVRGAMASLLTGERIALNFLQRLSGIATLTRQYQKALADSPTQVVDTRKTTPGWRVLEKYAVRCGGGHNHRMGLYDGILIKDNHIAACGGIPAAIERARQGASHLIKIEIEVSNFKELDAALAAGADVIMLDNMDDPQIRQAVGIVDGRALVEASGGVTLERLRALAACGVDLISVGALTHSAQAVDISMRLYSESEPADPISV